MKGHTLFWYLTKQRVFQRPEFFLSAIGFSVQAQDHFKECLKMRYLVMFVLYLRICWVYAKCIKRYETL